MKISKCVYINEKKENLRAQILLFSLFGANYVPAPVVILLIVLKFRESLSMYKGEKIIYRTTYILELIDCVCSV